MSAPTDRANDPNSVSYYAPRGARPMRLPPVEPMPPLLTELPPSGESRAPLVAANDPFEGDLAVQRLRARRSLDPEFAPAPPLPLRNRSWLAVVSRLVVVILAAAVVALIAIGQFPLPMEWRQAGKERGIELASTSTRSMAALSGKGSAETVIPRLLAQGSRGMSGEPAPLGVSLQGRADGGVIMITGLVAGMTLSNGSAVGADAWQVAATESVLGNTWILPPKDFVGTVDLVAELHLADATVAHRRPIHLEWVAAPVTVASVSPMAPAAPVAPAQRSAVPAAPAVAALPATAAIPAVAPAPAIAATPPAATAPPPAAAPPAAASPSPATITPAPAARPAAAPRQLDREEIAVLVKRGKDFIANGDLAAARLVLQRAAESKDAEAALALAATYDPLVLRELKVYGFAPDVAMARSWYEKAKEYGSTEAPRRLEFLATSTR
jgi:hypothetical protein